MRRAGDAGRRILQAGQGRAVEAGGRRAEGARPRAQAGQAAARLPQRAALPPRRVVLAGAGDGSGKRVHAAVQAAVATLRTTGRQAPGDLPAAGRRRTMRCAPPWRPRPRPATSTWPPSPSPKAANCSGSPSPWPTRRGTRPAFARRAGPPPNGIEFARELGNLPPNHATPTRLGEEASKLAKAHGFQCEVLGPKEIAKARHGLVPGRGPGLRAAAALHRPALPGRGARRRAGGAGGQGHHLRQRRHLDQAVAGHGRDEVRHGRRGQRAGRLPGARRPAARAQRDRPDPQLREHARRPLGQAGRHRRPA